jgi:sulfite reductase alpha subunit-like flavoprotein
MIETHEARQHDRTALILYGSETGNSQDVAEDLGRLAQRLHFVTRVWEMDEVDLVCLPSLAITTSHIQMLMVHGVENSIAVHYSSLCSRNDRARRVPEKC